MVLPSDSEPAFQFGRRAKPRLRLGLEAQLKLVGGLRPCIVEDISQTGARLALENTLAAGTSAMLLLLGLEAFGTLVWTTNAACGMEFEEPLELADIVMLRDRLDRWTADQKHMQRQSAKFWAQGHLGRKEG